MTRLALRCLLAVISLVGLLGIPPIHAQPAPADEAQREARAYVDAGIAAQSAGDHDAAIAFYDKAYALVPHPVLLFNIAQAHRLAGRADRAVAFYRKFLATHPTSDEAQLARDLLAELAAPEAEEASRDGEASRAAEALQSEPARKVDETPGAGDPSLVTDGSSVAHVMVPPPAPAPRGSDTAWSTKRKIAAGIAAGGVLALAAGTALGVSAMVKQRDAHTSCPDPPHLPCSFADRADDLIRSGHDRAIGANVAFGVGAAAVIAASVLWLIGEPPAAGGVAFAPAVSPMQVIAITASGRF